MRCNTKTWTNHHQSFISNQCFFFNFSYKTFHVSLLWKFFLNYICSKTFHQIGHSTGHEEIKHYANFIVGALLFLRPYPPPLPHPQPHPQVQHGLQVWQWWWWWWTFLWQQWWWQWWWQQWCWWWLQWWWQQWCWWWWQQWCWWWHVGVQQHPHPQHPHFFPALAALESAAFGATAALSSAGLASALASSPLSSVSSDSSSAASAVLASLASPLLASGHSHVHSCPASSSASSSVSALLRATRLPGYCHSSGVGILCTFKNRKDKRNIPNIVKYVAEYIAINILIP